MSTIAEAQRAAEITTRLKMVAPTSERRWGRMTAHQMICHLADAVRMALDVRPCNFCGSWASKHIVKYVALYSPLPWPKGVDGPPEMNQEIGGTRPMAFEADREELLALIGRLRAQPTDTPPPSHPMFGAMTWQQWMILTYRHCDHHFRQFGV